MSDQTIVKMNDEELGGVAGGMSRNLAAAYDVMAGKYGNGQARMNALRAAGYDANLVQDIVNNLLA